MRARLDRWPAVVLALALAALSVAAQGAMVARMNLGEMASNAGMIFRGTVLDIEQGSVTAGGAELPMVTYTLRVDDSFKGDFGSGKDTTVVTINMLGSIKSAPADGATQKVSSFLELPSLKLGHDYVLFMTAPSAIGLSSPVGLGQGSFSIYSEAKQEMAANELDNAGLFQGPVTYAELVAAINAALGQ